MASRLRHARDRAREWFWVRYVEGKPSFTRELALKYVKEEFDALTDRAKIPYANRKARKYLQRDAKCHGWSTGSANVKDIENYLK